MPILENIEFKKQELIQPGEYEFVIKDINIRTTQKEGEQIKYIVFEVYNEEEKIQTENWLSAPLSNTGKFAEKGKFNRIIEKLGLHTEKGETITNEDINNLIGKKFKAYIEYDEKGFARIDEKSIRLV